MKKTELSATWDPWDMRPPIPGRLAQQQLLQLTYMALLFMGKTHGVQGRLGQAFACFEKAAAVSEESGDERLLWGHHFYRLLAYLSGGFWAQAEQLADQLYADREEDKPIFQHYLLANIARTKIAMGKLREGEAILKQAFSFLDNVNHIRDRSAPDGRSCS